MKIVLSGVETNNKGAELMLYAILQQIEKKYPNADVFLRKSSVLQGENYVNTSLHFHAVSMPFFARVCRKLKIVGLLRRLQISCDLFFDFPKIKDVQYLLDGSGFAFSDQWKIDNYTISFWTHFIRYYKSRHAKVVFLPQAFGPVEQPSTRKVIRALSQYADVIMPREAVSRKYLCDCNVSTEKIKMFSDFTSLIHGHFPQQYTHLRNAVCVIPNMRMIDKGAISFDGYIDFLLAIIKEADENGKKVYLLNHEGKQDEYLAFQCKSRLGDCIEVVSGLNALEVKGLLSTAYLCVTSRFHGVASALNSCVPCLATSWSHKYEELFQDYNQYGCVLDIQSIGNSVQKVKEFLDADKNQNIRNQLKKELPRIQKQTEEMWNLVWNLN